MMLRRETGESARDEHVATRSIESTVSIHAPQRLSPVGRAVESEV